jgi:hypothetical protein
VRVGVAAATARLAVRLAVGLAAHHAMRRRFRPPGARVRAAHRPARAVLAARAVVAVRAVLAERDQQRGLRHGLRYGLRYGLRAARGGRAAQRCAACRALRAA